LGDGDFWVVDDNFGSLQHKVCVARISFLTRPLAVEVQITLRKYSHGWAVMSSLDKPELRPTEDDLGILVRQSDVREYWSAEQMRAAFGNEFR
jgi:hypothetical protein